MQHALLMGMGQGLGGLQSKFCDPPPVDSWAPADVATTLGSRDCVLRDSAILEFCSGGVQSDSNRPSMYCMT